MARLGGRDRVGVADVRDSVAPASVAFRFDADTHEYTDLETGAVLPHITGMLQATGWVDDTFMTLESRTRGSAVHDLTAQYDLGALDIKNLRSGYKGWVEAHVSAVEVLKKTARLQILAVEEPAVHAVLRFGGRPDRKVSLGAALGVLDEKSGPFAKSHPIQTALQAILIAPELNLPAEAVQRWALYLKANGRWSLDQHRSLRDFDEARSIIRRCCR